jgi:protein TonB
MELVTFEVAAPQPTPPAPTPPSEPVTPKVKATRKAFAVQKPPPKREETPPPNERAPEEPEKPVPVEVGISMSSTTTAGGYAAPVGNTLAGVNPTQAQPPATSKLSGSSDYVPIYQVDTQPSLLSDFVIPYPEDLKKRGIEGLVVLSLSIDAQGNVTNARVLSGPGYGLNEVARDAARKLKFRPATKQGKPVPTELTYRYRFELL